MMALTSIAYADEINFGKKKPSTNQVIDALSPAVTSPDSAGYEDEIMQNGKSRSIDMSNLNATPKTDKKKIKKTIHKALQKASTEAALSMEIFLDISQSTRWSLQRVSRKKLLH